MTDTTPAVRIVPVEPIQRLILAADSYGVRYLDSDDLSAEAQELQDATEAMKDALAAAPFAPAGRIVPERFYIGCEFDGHNGPLLSIAIVREDGDSIHIRADVEPMDLWVRHNVLPIMDSHRAPKSVKVYHDEVGGVILGFIGESVAPVIVADSPVDIGRFCRALSTGPDGQWASADYPLMTFEVHNVNCYPTELEGAVQHNAWWDAMALRHALAAAPVAPGEGVSDDELVEIIHRELGGDGWAYSNYGHDERKYRRSEMIAAGRAVLAAIRARSDPEAVAEKRQCDVCGYKGSSADAHPELDYCTACGGNSPANGPDQCRHCGTPNCMVMACPKCEGRFSLSDEPEAGAVEIGEKARAILNSFHPEWSKHHGGEEALGWLLDHVAHPATSDTSATERMRAEVREAITTLAMLKRNVNTEIAKHDGLFRWEGVPEAIQSRIDALSAALGEA